MLYLYMFLRVFGLTNFLYYLNNPEEMFVQMETQNNRSVYINMYSTNALKCDGERLQLKKRKKKRRSLFFEYQPSLTVCAFLSFQELINLNACVSVGVLRQFCIWELALIVIVIHNPHSGPKTENCRWYCPFDLARVHQIEMIFLIFRTCKRTLFNVTPPLYRQIVMVVVRSRYLSVTRKQGPTFISKTFSVTVFPFSVIVFPDLCISKVKHLFNIMYWYHCMPTGSRYCLDYSFLRLKD